MAWFTAFRPASRKIVYDPALVIGLHTMLWMPGRGMATTGVLLLRT